MLVANTFDLWQKDTFFSAAEEVQQSADIMESSYRTWLKARKEGLVPQQLDELGRELRMALGTTKWQLEEFEKAVRLSYRNNGDDITINRHSQFVSAIEDQISCVETALKESLYMEGKKPFRWVNLDDEECDDLAHFLSGTPGVINRKEDSNFGSNISSRMQIPNQGKRSEEILTSTEDINSFMEPQESKFPETEDEISYQADQLTSNRRAWSSPNRTSLEIVIDSGDRQNDALIEATPKEKGFKPFFWRSRCENYPGAKEMLIQTHMKMIIWMNQHLRGSQRQQVSPVFPVNSTRFFLALMLTIFFVVPFLLYST